MGTFVYGGLLVVKDLLSYCCQEREFQIKYFLIGIKNTYTTTE